MNGKQRRTKWKSIKRKSDACSIIAVCVGCVQMKNSCWQSFCWTSFCFICICLNSLVCGPKGGVRGYRELLLVEWWIIRLCYSRKNAFFFLFATKHGHNGQCTKHRSSRQIGSQQSVFAGMKKRCRKRFTLVQNNENQHNNKEKEKRNTMNHRRVPTYARY